MRVAITADPYVPVPPRYYGGIERVVDFLVRGLVARGHEVTLIAHPESNTPARLVPYGAPPHFGWARRARELGQVAAALWQLRGAVDLIHSFGRLAAMLPVLPVRSLPKIQSYQREIPVAGLRRARLIAGGSVRFTACASHMYQARGVPGDWTTVFNGVCLDKYTYVPSVAREAPLVFLGRLERIKGAHSAISIAKASGRRLKIAGNVVRGGPGGRYFDEEIAPSIDGEAVEYVGPVDDVQKNRLLGGAAALLMPVQWEEPFGIVMVEAMACGTPVIAFSRGSVPEVVRNGVNGFACENEGAAVEAVAKVHALPRELVRRDAEKRFCSRVIVSAYERLYERSLDP